MTTGLIPKREDINTLVIPFINAASVAPCLPCVEILLMDSLITFINGLPCIFSMALDKYSLVNNLFISRIGSAIAAKYSISFK